MIQNILTFVQIASARFKEPIVLILAATLLFIAAVNVATGMSDIAYYKLGVPWQFPVMNQFSSTLATILLLPFLLEFFDRHPFSKKKPIHTAGLYVGVSVAFTALHILPMVTLRTILYPLNSNETYEFFDKYIVERFVYEYRKDVVIYVILLIIFSLHKQIRQTKQQAQENNQPVSLKSGGTTILLQPDEFIYAKGAANYAEITSSTGLQLARITLSNLETALKEKGCDVTRIHRSYLVNRTAIRETSPIAGGDLAVKLIGGEILRASRRYKNNLRTH